MTLPTLIKNYQAMVLQNQFKQAYAELNNASKMFQIHNDMSLCEYAAGNNSTKTILSAFSKEFNAVLKTSSLGVNSKDEDGNINAVPYAFYSIDKKTQHKLTVCDTGGWFWDTKGRLIGFDDKPSAGYNGPKVCIDINGEKAPNRFGVDFFVFYFTVDGYVIPYGQYHKNNNYTEGTIYTTLVVSPIEDYCKYSNSSYTYIATCSNFALINQHPSKSGKDYWHDFINGK